MSIGLQSFYRSPLGAFIESPLGARGIGVAAEGPWFAINDTGSPYKILVSTDGVSWTENTKEGMAPAYPNWFFNGRIFGRYTNTIYKSADMTGFDWSLAKALVSDVYDNQMLVLSSGRLLIISRADHKCYYSDDDGDTWATVVLPTTIYGGVIRGVVRVLSSGRIMTGGFNNSTPSATKRAMSFYSDDDGATWSQAIVDDSSGGGSPNCTDCGTLLYNGTTLYLIAYKAATATKRLYSSTDGVTWVYVQDVGIGPRGEGQSYCDGFMLPSGRQVVAIPYTNTTQTLWYSDDNGRTWTKVGGDGASYTPLRRVGDNLYRLIYSSPNTILQVSADGVNWTTKGTLGNYSTNSFGLAIGGMVTQ